MKLRFVWYAPMINKHGIKNFIVPHYQPTATECIAYLVIYNINDIFTEIVNYLNMGFNLYLIAK